MWKWSEMVSQQTAATAVAKALSKVQLVLQWWMGKMKENRDPQFFNNVG